MDEREPRLSGPTLKVLRLYLMAPRAEHSGADISKRTKVGAGTLYPLLARLETAGWLTSEWENLDPKEAGRPRKRFYRITAVGQNKGRAALEDLQMDIPAGGIAWNS